MRQALTALLVAPLLVVALGGAAGAHRPQVKVNLLRLDGNLQNGFLMMRPTGHGHITLTLPGPAVSGRLVIDFRHNGVVKPPVSYPFQGTRGDWLFGFDTTDQDKLEIVDLRVLNENDDVIAVLGSAPHAARGAELIAAPLVWVVDSPSDVGFTRGGDVLLSKTGGWSVGFDALRSRSTGDRLHNTGNYAEIEVSVNDGPWVVHSVTFDVSSGRSKPNGRPGINIGTHPGDRIRVKRVDAFDAQGNKFATFGIRMGKQGHYEESSLTPTPTPTAAPTPTPTPLPTPDPTPTSDPTPSPSPEPTPDPTPSPDPTPDPTPSPDPTPEPTP